MTIETRCASCGAEYQLAEHQAGMHVRCKHCDATILVPSPREVIPLDNRGPGERFDREPPDRDSTRQGAPRGQSGGNWSVPLLILGIVVVVVGLPLAACGTGAYFIYRGVRKTVQDFGDAVSPHDPADVEEALSYLSSTYPIKVQTGCKWIASHSIAAGDRERVAKALDPRLTDGNVVTRVEAARALKKHVSKDNVGSLISALDTADNFFNVNEAAETRRLAIEMLAQLKDERAITPIARRLKDAKDRPHASQALIDFGAKSAPELKRMLDEPDPAVRDEVRKILRAVLPDENNDVVFALADLRFNDNNRRIAACRTLAQARVDPKQQADVRAALDIVIRDGEQNLRYESACALRQWATLDDVDTLVRALTQWCGDDFQPKNPETRKVILEVLGKLRAEQAVSPIAGRLRNASDRAAAGKALLAIGGPAVSEELRKREADEADPLVRDEARRLLKQLPGG